MSLSPGLLYAHGVAPRAAPPTACYQNVRDHDENFYAQAFTLMGKVCRSSTMSFAAS